MKEIQKIREELMKKRILLFFELEKELGEDDYSEGEKNDKTLA